MEVTKTKSYTHLATGSDKVCFMFSGVAYTYDKPLFYYATMIMLENKIDVIHIHYPFNAKKLLKQPFTAIAKTMIDDVGSVVTEVLHKKQYNEIIFLGKSIGTIPITGEFMKNDTFRAAKMILLTPVLMFDEFFQTVIKSKHHGLLVIGNKDKNYKEEKIEKLNETNFDITVIPQANHSLDIEGFDTTSSISVLATVMKKLQHAIAD
ncbi:alpha/beta hydrolase [Bacillaceae bacterium Marseille-Q3522]|nr:alpha/beta hydrolase [Bacillaceae bacterium Marseille-Q3522]